MVHLIYNNAYGLRCAVIRLTNTDGPRMRVTDARQTFLGVWTWQMIEGRTIQVYGDGSQLRVFNFVDDVALALMVAASSDEANGPSSTWVPTILSAFWKRAS